jgi:predicted DNA-binding transcriptional regulator AlpA
MTVHEFCVVASGLDPTADDFESRFYEAGCDDATISFQRGHVIADFSREATSVEEAVASAIEGVVAAGARVERIEPDTLVSLADIAARSGLSRAAITQYAKAQRGKGFPAPIAKVTSDSPLWDWADVAAWLFRHDRLTPEALIAAEVLKRANDILGAGGIPTLEMLRQRRSVLEPAA